MAPNVISPPEICATGILKGTEDATAANISKRSPKQIIKSYFSFFQIGENLIIVKPIESAIDSGESPSTKASTLCFITNPSSRILLEETP
ncbi:hypothetical protein D3C71_1154750 [compost metagenome]